VTIGQSLLSPLGWIYGSVSFLRARAYRAGLLKQRRLNGTVISVGNLTTGGTGKTPMVLWIAQRLLEEGKRPGILTRGYRGNFSSSPGETGLPDSTSDEVKLLKARLGESVAFGVGPDRFARGSELARQDVKWFVLDDGFQHLALARDVDIVLLDATNPFGGGHLLPAGRLREPRSALARADVVVVTRANSSPAIEAAIRRDFNGPIFYARPRLESIVDCATGKAASEAFFGSEECFAFCGIGNPDAFVANLKEWGISVAGSRFFRDHHRYTQRDISDIQAEARRSGAKVAMCTEKDVFNLPSSGWQGLRLLYCRIALEVDKGDEFWAFLSERARSRS
jgi:tetraacyldisaccharide 4'-kinase